ncbi:MAG: hypothetical protein WCH60_03345 [Burkholderiales bacterium]
MTFWKRLRLIGSVIVLVLAVVATVGALTQPAPINTDPPQTTRSSDSLQSGTKGL